MLNYLLGAFGIVVSVILFFVGYRQTIGARKERITGANVDLERILLRRVVLEGFSPAQQDLERLRDGKAREYRVGSSDILLPVELMNTVYTRIVENDFISPDLRKDIVERLNPLCERLSKADEHEPEVASKSATVSSLLVVLLGFLTSLLGAAITVLPKLKSLPIANNKDVLEALAVTASISFGIIASYLVFTRLREQQEESTPRSVVAASVEFESAVAAAIRKTGLLVMHAPVQSGYDFAVIRKDGSKVLVEAKGWPKRVPKTILSVTIDRLRNLVAKEDAKEAILVLRESLQYPLNLVGDAPVKILALREVRNYFAH